MINTDYFMGLGSNTKKWKPNSNYSTNQKGIYKSSLYKWKKYLKADVREFIETVVGIEMKFLGYKNRYNSLSKLKISKFHKKDFAISEGWRTTKNYPQNDIDLEISRYKFL